MIDILDKSNRGHEKEVKKLKREIAKLSKILSQTTKREERALKEMEGIKAKEQNLIKRNLMKLYGPLQAKFVHELGLDMKEIPPGVWDGMKYILQKAEFLLSRQSLDNVQNLRKSEFILLAQKKHYDRFINNISDYDSWEEYMKINSAWLLFHDTETWYGYNNENIHHIN